MRPIIHFTTVHPRTDTRVRVKEVGTLTHAFGVPVALYVQDGLGNKKEASVAVVDTGSRSRFRLARMTVGAWRMYRAVRRARPLVAHFHDPELIPVGLLLKLSGTKVVYDVHEDVPRQIASKGHIPRILRRPAATVSAAFERMAGRFFDGIVPATPVIQKRFPNRKCALVRNFPLLDELVIGTSGPYASRPSHIAYVGAITVNRGIRSMVDALGIIERPEVVLRLAGAFQPEVLHEEARGLRGWSQVQFSGWATRREIAKILAEVRVGLVLLRPTPAYVEALPVKLFEYMAAGLPVIASDFPLWRQIVERAQCGLLVDPLDPEAIAGAVRWILDNPVEAEAMGRRGQQAVRERYNWEAEATKLLGLYERLLEHRPELARA